MASRDGIGLFGTMIGVAMVPALGSGGWDVWELTSVGSVTLGGLGLLAWPYLSSVYQNGSGIVYGEIRPARADEADAIHALAIENFGSDVTSKVQIASLIRKNQKMFWVFESHNRTRTVSVLEGYACVIPLSHTQHRDIQSGHFGVNSLSPVDVPRGNSNTAAIYIGAIAAQKRVVSGKLLGFIEAHAGQMARRTRSRMVYAKAVTTAGLRTVEKRGFDPVHPGSKGLGAYYQICVS